MSAFFAFMYGGSFIIGNYFTSALFAANEVRRETVMMADEVRREILIEEKNRPIQPTSPAA